MREVKGNIWDYYKQGHWIVITTNGIVKANGEAVMGKGVALQAKQRFPQLPKKLGELLRYGGNHVYVMWGLGLLTFPTKNHWRDNAMSVLIERSSEELISAVLRLDRHKKEVPEDDWSGEVYMPRPGCGNGGLDWKDVKPVLEKYLDDRFIVVEMK